jgi:exosortase/archaeosortase
LLLAFYLENQELSRAVSYFEFLSHKRLHHFLDGYTWKKGVLMNGYFVVITFARGTISFLFYLYQVEEYVSWCIAQNRLVLEIIKLAVIGLNVFSFANIQIFFDSS